MRKEILAAIIMGGCTIIGAYIGVSCGGNPPLETTIIGTDSSTENMVTISISKNGDKNEINTYEDDNFVKSEDWIDLIESGIVPCIDGDDNLYYTFGLNSSEFISTYKKEYEYKIKSNSDTEGCYTTYDLEKKYKKLKFDLALDEDWHEDTIIVKIYSGGINNKKMLLKGKIHPGDKDKSFIVDIRNVSKMTIVVSTPDFGSSQAITNGFKIQLK